MGHFLSTLILLVTLVLVGCTSPATTPAPSPQSSSAEIDPSQAREFSDSVVRDFIENNREGLFLKMESQARREYGKKGFDEVLDTLESTQGKPIVADFKKDTIGKKVGIGGYDKPMRKYWYMVETSKFPKEKHFIFVEVVPDGDYIACSSLGIVEFYMGVPTDMR